MVSRFTRLTVGGSPRVVDLLSDTVADRNGFVPLTIRGGGYVTGLSVHSSGRIYARTDVGGAYRRDPANDTWIQMITASGIASPHPSDYLVEGLACAPSNPDVVYASVGNPSDYGINGRVLSSSDGGVTWAASARNWYISGNEEWRYGGVRIAVDPDNANVVYLGTRKDGLHYSTDGAATWTKLTALPAAVGDPTTTDAVGVHCVLIDPTSTISGGRYQTMWAAVRGVGLCKTTNGGTTWSTVSAFTTGWVRDMTLASTGDVFACFYDPAYTTAAVRRISPANTVTTITPATGRGWSTIAVDPTNPDVAFVATDGLYNDDQQFWRTANATAATPTWVDLAMTLDNGAKGTVWPDTSDILDWMSVGQMRIVGGVLWFAEGMGTWRTSDLTGTSVAWEFASDGIEEMIANDILKAPGCAVVTASWDRGLFTSPDPTNRNPTAEQASYLSYRGGFGAAWDLVASPTDPLFLAAILDDTQDLTGNTYPDRRASGYSTDGGYSWTRFGALEDETAPANMLFGNIAVSANNNDNLVWIPSRLSGTSSRIYYTTDRGDTWGTATLTGLASTDRLHPTFTNDRHILAAHPTVAGTFYAIGWSGTTAVLWKSTNNGATWAKATTSGLDRGATDFSGNNTFIILGAPLTFLAASNDALFRSSDGVTWTTVPGITGCVGLGVGAPMTTAGSPALYTYATVNGTIGLHRSVDYGNTWTFLVAYPNNCHREIRGMAGDPDIPGRVYLGFSGLSYAVGDYA